MYHQFSTTWTRKAESHFLSAVDGGHFVAKTHFTKQQSFVSIQRVYRIKKKQMKAKFQEKLHKKQFVINSTERNYIQLEWRQTQQDAGNLTSTGTAKQQKTFRALVSNVTIYAGTEQGRGYRSNTVGDGQSRLGRINRKVRRRKHRHESDKATTCWSEPKFAPGMQNETSVTQVVFTYTFLAPIKILAHVCAKGFLGY